ncbi:MAG: hypothetical protein NTZ63_02775 [Candidatus Omnitrophica bacterium]|nr:hypothetical protein [Candidatus Omnitrophota bacterium]
MFKKLYLSLIPAILFFVSLAFAADETLTITTYYPSPYGSYNELKTNYLQFGKISVPPTENDPCVLDDEGKVSYNSKEKMLYLCIGNYWVRLVRDLSQEEAGNRMLKKQAIPSFDSAKEVLNVKGDFNEHKYDESILELTKAINLDPNYFEGYKKRAVFYYFKHEYGNAWNDVHSAEKLGAIISQRFLEDLKKASNRKD